MPTIKVPDVQISSTLCFRASRVDANHLVAALPLPLQSAGLIPCAFVPADRIGRLAAGRASGAYVRANGYYACEIPAVCW